MELSLKRKKLYGGTQICWENEFLLTQIAPQVTRAPGCARQECVECRELSSAAEVGSVGQVQLVQHGLQLRHPRAPLCHPVMVDWRRASLPCSSLQSAPLQISREHPDPGCHARRSSVARPSGQSLQPRITWHPVETTQFPGPAPVCLGLV